MGGVLWGGRRSLDAISNPPFPGRAALTWALAACLDLCLLFSRGDPNSPIGAVGAYPGVW